MSKTQQLLFDAAGLRLQRFELDSRIRELEREASITALKARQGTLLRKYSSNHQQTISDAAVAAAYAAKDEADLHRALVSWTDDLANANANLTQAVVVRDYALEALERSRANLFVESSAHAINQRDMDRAYTRFRESRVELEQARFGLLAASNALEAQEAVPPPLRRA